MGPPLMVPKRSFSRYFTASTASANLVAMPTRPVTHIQKRAPGPPAARAVATPAMFPVPTVAERAVIRAWKWVMSPSSAPGSFRLTNARWRA